MQWTAAPLSFALAGVVPGGIAAPHQVSVAERLEIRQRRAH